MFRWNNTDVLIILLGEVVLVLKGKVKVKLCLCFN
jgi:hypothetical protein